MSKDDLGDRMKGYEMAEAGRKAMPLLPIIVRLDGCGFSKLTKNITRPFSAPFHDWMVETTKQLVEYTNAKIGYTQSDEITLVLYADTTKSQLIFDGRLQKLMSILAAKASVWFNRESAAQAVFDCRAWNVPTLAEAANAVLWRERDATKNSVSMLARCHFSHKELQNKSAAQMQAMLLTKGVNWNDEPAAFKRGTFVRRVTEWRPLEPEVRARLLAQEQEVPLGVERSRVVAIEMPPFGRVGNRESVIFEDAAPYLFDYSHMLTEKALAEREALGDLSDF